MIDLSRLNGGTTLPIISYFAIPTSLIGSTVYPSNRPEPAPKQSIPSPNARRTDAACRVIVLFKHGLLLGTPLNLVFFVVDAWCDFAGNTSIGKRLWTHCSEDPSFSWLSSG
ncbi:hypothetical protein NX059_001139 [Plenodomus lindquistii]|nr:hypothetical protein NX059_001139 [Plenodomus lindquistii]